MTIEQVKELVRPNIAALKPYSTARDEYKGNIGIYLDANENPFENGYNRYPSTTLKGMVRNTIAQKKGVDSANLFLGNGSDEAIDLLFRIFCRPGVDNIISIAPTYGMYGVCAAINDIEYREVMLEEDFALPVNELLSASDEQSKLLFVCSPNNPTANAYSREQLTTLVKQFPGIVIVDEAYIDFSSVPSMVELIEEYPNLIVLQTLSKAYGLAGLRNHHHNLAGLCNAVHQFLHRVSADDVLTGATTLYEVLYLLGGTVVNGHSETLGFHIQHQVFTHNGQANQANISFFHCESPYIVNL